MFWRAKSLLYLLCALCMEDMAAGRAGPKGRVAKFSFGTLESSMTLASHSGLALATRREYFGYYACKAQALRYGAGSSDLFLGGCMTSHLRPQQWLREKMQKPEKATRLGLYANRVCTATKPGDGLTSFCFCLVVLRPA